MDTIKMEQLVASKTNPRKDFDKAGLTEIFATVRELSDAEAQQVQIIENLQRKDLHPLEEADDCQKLWDSHGANPDDLAVKVGKSKAYIYQRLKLLALLAEAKRTFETKKRNGKKSGGKK